MSDMELGGYLLEEGDLRLYYQHRGSSNTDETLVFIHGHSVDCRMWKQQIEYFTEEYATLCYDMRGYGESSFPQEGQDYLHAEDLHLLLKELSIGRVHLVGLSLGAFVALDYWALYPQNVLSVTVASGAIPDPRPTHHIPIETDVEAFKKEWYESLIQSCGPVNNGYRQRLWEMIRDWSAWQPAHREPECLLREGLLPRLKHAGTIPVCVIIGGQDSEGSRRSSQKLLEYMPHAKCVNLKDAGHFSNMETPDEFNRELQAFLQHIG